MKGVVIQASARSEGNTYKIIRRIQDIINVDVIDINQKSINFYQYDQQQQDDFLPVIEQVVNTYDVIILATPVYWYSMSAQMKSFLDRITECLKTEKATGRKLRGKYLAALSCGSDAAETPGFFVPFSLSAVYLGMHYIGHVHTWIGGDSISKEVELRIEAFCEMLTNFR